MVFITDDKKKRLCEKMWRRIIYVWVVKIFFVTPAQIVECVAIDIVQQPIQRTATSPSLRDLGDPVFLRVSRPVLLLCSH